LLSQSFLNQDALRFITRNSDRKNLTPVLLAATLEARELNHAIQLVSELPGFKYGLGPIEIRPAADLNEIIKASEQRRQQKTAR
jgi:hypothetical protein